MDGMDVRRRWRMSPDADGGRLVDLDTSSASLGATGGRRDDTLNADDR